MGAGAEHEEEEEEGEKALVCFLVLNVCKGKGLFFASKLTCSIQMWNIRMGHIVNEHGTSTRVRG